MNAIDDATRARYAITGWPAPVGEERCTRLVSLRKGRDPLTQCRHRRAEGDVICQQHQRQFLCCGGTESNPPEHTHDCNRRPKS